MGEGAARKRLAKQALPHQLRLRRAGEPVRVNDLNRNLPGEPGINGCVNDTHCPAAQFAGDHIAVNALQTEGLILEEGLGAGVGVSFEQTNDSLKSLYVARARG